MENQQGNEQVNEVVQDQAIDAAPAPTWSPEQMKEMHARVVGNIADNAVAHIKQTKAQAFMLVIITADGMIETMKTAAPGEIAPFDDIEALLTKGCTLPEAQG